jgi:hydrogenase-4 membrane subunit HyfE
VNGVDTLFLLVVLAPLFVARWRVSLLGLAAQGVLLWYASGGSTPTFDDAWAFDLVDFLVLRAGLAPGLLYLAFRRPDVPDRNDVIPANLLAWMVVVLLVLVSFRFAGTMAPAGPESGRVAVAATSLVLGFFVLATQRNVFSQIIGALRIENAVALLEAHGEGAPVHPAARVAQLVVLAGAIGLYVWYLEALAARPAADHDDDPDVAVVPGEEAS